MSWVPARLRGYQATNTYLLNEGRSWLLIDLGPDYQADIVVRQLKGLLPSDAALSVFVTRCEPDTYGSLAALLLRLQIERGLAWGVHNPFDAVDQLKYANRANHGETILECPG